MASQMGLLSLSTAVNAALPYGMKERKYRSGDGNELQREHDPAR